MKWFGWILVVLIAASPAWAARKVTVQQLKDMLTADQQAKKADAEVAADLKQVELTEQLSRPTMNALAEFLPGPYSTEQIYVLEARSGLLPPPAADLPTTPAPDAATQKAILDKATDYATKIYAQLPTVTATKTIVRFQEISSASIAGSNADPEPINTAQTIHYINTSEASVNIHNGIEDNPLAKDKTRWGQNGYIALLGQSPVVSTVLEEANSAGKIGWLRWEPVNGKTTAVFTYSVDKKKSHYAVNYCCFPKIDSVGMTHASSAAPGLLGTSGGSGKGTFRTDADFEPYRATVPYHGEIFVDPDTGIVVCLITQADFKNTDDVHVENQRIEYAPVVVGGKTLVLPSRSIVNTEAIPNGDSGVGQIILRHTLFTSEYKGYQPASN